jgi:hypothetical protein
MQIFVRIATVPFAFASCLNKPARTTLSPSTFIQLSYTWEMNVCIIACQERGCTPVVIAEAWELVNLRQLDRRVHLLIRLIHDFKLDRRINRWWKNRRFMNILLCCVIFPVGLRI